MQRIINKLLRKEKEYQVRVNFYRLDPQTDKLVVYNNLELPIKAFTLYIYNFEGVEYKIRFKAMEPQEGIVLERENIKDKNGIAFTGKIKLIKAITSKGIETFIQEGNQIKRC